MSKKNVIEVGKSAYILMPELNRRKIVERRYVFNDYAEVEIVEVIVVRIGAEPCISYATGKSYCEIKVVFANESDVEKWGHSCYTPFSWIDPISQDKNYLLMEALGEVKPLMDGYSSMYRRLEEVLASVTTEGQ